MARIRGSRLTDLRQDLSCRQQEGEDVAVQTRTAALVSQRGSQGRQGVSKEIPDETHDDEDGDKRANIYFGKTKEMDGRRSPSLLLSSCLVVSFLPS